LEDGATSSNVQKVAVRKEEVEGNERVARYGSEAKRREASAWTVNMKKGEHWLALGARLEESTNNEEAGRRPAVKAQETVSRTDKD
jgi:hypothetical protein